MNRLIIVLIIGAAVALLGIIGFSVVLYITLSTDEAGGPKKPTPPPFSYKQLKDMEEKPDKVAAEIPRLIACFESGDDDICFQAAENLRTTGVKAVDPLRARLADKNADVRYYSAYTLSLLGTDAAPAAPELVACLQDKDGKVRHKAVYALGNIGVRTDAVFNGILQLMESDHDLAQTAIPAIEKLGTPPKEAVTPLAKIAKNKDTPEDVRQSAIKLLGKLGAPTVPTFRDLLKEPRQPHERTVLFEAISALGSDAKPLVPDLTPILSDQITGQFGIIDPNLIDIFKKSGPDGAKAMAEILKKVDRDAINFQYRLTLLKALGEMRAPSEANESVPILIDLLKSGTPTHPIADYRMHILETLGDIGIPAKAAIPTVETLTTDRVPAVAEGARIALRRMGKLEKK